MVDGAAGAAALGIVLGGGSGIGRSCAERFAKEGLVACLVRRGVDRKNQTQRLVGKNIVEFSGYDVTQSKQVKQLLRDIDAFFGPGPSRTIRVCIYNVGAQQGHVSIFADNAEHRFLRAFQGGAFGAFVAAHVVGKRMVRQGGPPGTLVFTSSSAAMRGGAGQQGHAAAMAGRRMLCQALLQELGPSGLHVCHVVVDAAVNSPSTLGRMVDKATGQQGAFALLAKRKAAEGTIVQPDSVASAVWFLCQQTRDAWTFEMDLRPWREKAWFHSSAAPRPSATATALLASL